MRYIKVLLLVILFFLVMMFFVQNQSAFSQAVALKLDLLFLPPVESAPLPFYTPSASTRGSSAASSTSSAARATSSARRSASSTP